MQIKPKDVRFLCFEKRKEQRKVTAYLGGVGGGHGIRSSAAGLGTMGRGVRN